MRFLALFSITAIVASGYAAPIYNGTAINPIIDLGYASYVGTHNASTDITSWYGIRYAQAPVGNLRWAAPRDIESTNSYTPSEPINATVFGPTCIQGAPAWEGFTFSYSTVESEDCLLLDVKVPAKPASDRLPVMVQIHGGGYTLGSSETVAPGDSLIYQSNGGIIYVSIQYRLGAYGFLGGADIAERGALNAGLLDQRAALEWVQRHVSAFGGDPGQVTIIGQSAGGGSVMCQMILYGGDPAPPFKAVIAEYPWWQPFHDRSIQRNQYAILLNVTACDSLTCMRALPEAELAAASQQSYLAAYAKGYYGYGDYYYGPTVDGSVIRQLPSEAFEQGHFTKVPLLVDHEEYEGALFTNVSLMTLEEELADLSQLWPRAQGSFFTSLFQLYPTSAFNSTFFQRQQIFGDAFVSCPTYQMATAVSNMGQPVYKMIFDAGTQIHGSLIPFAYGTIPGIVTTFAGAPNNETLATYIRDYYLSFAVYEDPSAHSFSSLQPPQWPLYHPVGSDDFRVLDINYTMVGVRNDPDASSQCYFLQAQGYTIEN